MIRANIPFISITHLIDLQEVNGVNLGFRYHNRWGAKDIAVSISDGMKNKLVNQILSNKLPISLTVDTSDAGYHYLCLISNN